MAAFIELSHISKRFGGVHALDAVDLTLEAGEIHCLVGENGSGKSTLIKIVSGVQRPEAGGRIIIEGREYPYLNPKQSTHSGIQVIYQDLSLFPNLTVAENIAIGRHFDWIGRVDWPEMRKIAVATMSRIGVGLDLDAKVADLSVAQRQLVAICRAMTAQAKLLIMDEPTASLTRKEVDSLLAVVRDLKRKGICIVFVSHRLDEVMEVAERVTVLRDGVKVGTYEADLMNDNKLATLMTGKEFHYDLTETDLTDREVVLSVKNLTCAGDYEDVSFEVRAGEIVGLTGLLGSGRTELALTIFGMNPAHSGVVRLGGKVIPLRTNSEAITHGIAYVPEDRLTLGLVLQQPISSNIVITVLDRLANRIGLLNPANVGAHVARWIKELGIRVSDPERPVSTLSGGNQQRLVLAKWMATNPRLLILDSPTVGVDISAKDGIYEIIRRLAADGVAVILISDEIPEVLYHTHRVLVMRQGRLTAEFAPLRSSQNEVRAAVNA